jgi:uncharacterized membrane protein YdjX (TVP38/TMEM64 family)
VNISKRTLLKAGLGFLLLLLLAFAATQLPVLEILKQVQQWVNGWGNYAVLLYAGIFAVAAILMIPCMPLTIAAGIFLGWLKGVTAVMLGTALAAGCCFLLSRYFAREKLADKLRHLSKFAAIDRAIAQEGWKIVILLRMLPVPFGLSNYLYGLTAISFGHYMFATLAGMFHGNAIFVYLGSIGKRGLEGGGFGTHPLEYMLTGLSICAAITISVMLKRIARKAVHDETLTGGK